MDSFLILLEASALGSAIRSSVWIYPTGNVLHVLGVILLFAAVAVMDMRILFGRAGGAGAFLARIRPWAVAALGLVLVTGFLLFVPEAAHIGANPVFQAKLATIALALLNVTVLEIAVRCGTDEGPFPSIAKAAALVSFILWLTVAALGRLIAYF